MQKTVAHIFRAILAVRDVHGYCKNDAFYSEHSDKIYELFIFFILNAGDIVEYLQTWYLPVKQLKLKYVTIYQSWTCLSQIVLSMIDIMNAKVTFSRAGTTLFCILVE